MPVTLVEGAHVLAGFASDDTPILHEGAAVAVDGAEVLAIGPVDELARRYPEAARLGGPRAVVIPGLINAHHHVGLTPLQLGSPDHPLELWFASRLALRDVDLYADTLYAAFEMIASGVTTVQHLHSRAPGGPDAVLGAAREVTRAYRDIGMRASYSMALRDQNRLVYEADRDFVARLPEDLRPAMAAYFERFTLSLEDQAAILDALLAEYRDDPLIRVQVAPSNLHWLSDRALELAGEIAERADVPMHMHLLETPYQKAYAGRRTGGSALAHLHRLGLTGPRLTIGHGVWMTEDDIDLCASTGTRICHNCSSNFRLKSGVAPVNRFRARGIPVAIGIDEAGINDDRDMLQEMRLVLRAHREPGIDVPHPSPAAVLRMATEHGAGTTPFRDRIGRLAPGCAADLVVLDWDAVTYPYQSPDLPLVDVLVQRAKAGAVRDVMIGGEVVYRDGRFTRVDRDAVLADIAERMRRPLTAAEEERRALARAVFPHVRRFYDGYLDGLGDDPFYRVSGRA
jgi:cytosine/adenosine deaminase-related metal-dependent hydrolase